MNKKTVGYSVAIALAAMTLTGCSTLQSSSSSSSSSKKQTAVAATGSSASHTSTASNSLEANISGEWFITAIGTTSISQDEDMPYLTFVPAEGRFYGSNGCNVLNGDYQLVGNVVKFNNVLSTQKYCPEVTFDSQITTFVQDGKSATATLRNSGNETYLQLVDNETHTTMTICRHNMQFLNGQWQVSDINGKGVNDEEANIFFDISELKIHGNTGCNFFNGSILIDPAQTNSINFSGMAVTRMSCPKLDQERLMLVALEETATAVLNSDGSASLRNSSGKTVLKLKRVEISND
jgi:heat shock protein HslJ